MTDTMSRPASTGTVVAAPPDPPAAGLVDRPGWPPADLPAPGAPPIPPPDGPAAGTRAGSDRWRRRLGAAGVTLVLMLGGGASGALAVDRLVGDGTAAAAVRVTPAGAIDTLSGVVGTVSPSIVTVTAAGNTGTSLGSGVILDRNGLILTNAHVIESGGRLSVQLADGRTAPATLVGRDTGADIALLRADGLSGLTPATLGTDSTLRVGDTVLAFGSPLGLAGTVTSGIVSALDRSVDGMTGLVQTDAAINHGNSGGALVDTAGRVVGINVAIATAGQDDGSIGLGFAIPIDTVRTVVDHLTDQAAN
ncbi:S1C family serine protease [Micromonospora sp. MS34]|uniref:S1C family serine protease n=1 Tax=Micromonospora sp. MS34 TaxID=3385971 RepID=UPI0039A038C1